jgi:hypothetical protein
MAALVVIYGLRYPEQLWLFIIAQFGQIRKAAFPIEISHVDEFTTVVCKTARGPLRIQI